MNIKYIHLYRAQLELKTPFQTHAGTVKRRELILVEMVDSNHLSGWGEGVAFSTPFYTSETVDTSWHMLEDVFIPLLKSRDTLEHPLHIYEALKDFQGNQMAKAALEGAAWDLYAKQQGKPLSQLIGRVRNSIEAGVVLSLQDNLEELVPKYAEDGYKRFKLKVEKYQEREALEKVSKLAPTVSLMFDGNGAYQEEDIDHLASLDDLGLEMIEQPFEAGDFFLHQKLQEKMNTPICLDESIESYHDAFQAIMLKSCKIINIKIGRVGGLYEALQIHDLCEENGIPVWCGGMLESGVSRAHNIALASLPQFTIPGDISSSSRYWPKDIIIPEVKVENGLVSLPDGEGIGFDVDRSFLKEITVNNVTFEM